MTLTYLPGRIADIEFRGRVLERWCEPILNDNPCCNLFPAVPPGPSCGGFPPFPDTLFLTLSGFAHPFICNWTPTLASPPLNYSGVLYSCNDPPTLRIGLLESSASAWQNGSYRLKRINRYSGVLNTPEAPIAIFANYILADSYDPFRNGSTNDPYVDVSPHFGGFPYMLHGTNNFPELNGYAYGSFIDKCYVSPRDYLTYYYYPLEDQAQILVSPGMCEYNPGCDFDFVGYGCPPYGLNYASFTQTAVQKWIDYLNSPAVHGICWPEINSAIGPFGFRYKNNVFPPDPDYMFERSPFAIRHRTWKQCILTLMCVVIGSVARICIVDLTMVTYLERIVSYIVQFSDPLIRINGFSTTTAWINDFGGPNFHVPSTGIPPIAICDPANDNVCFFHFPIGASAGDDYVFSFDRCVSGGIGNPPLIIGHMDITP